MLPSFIMEVKHYEICLKLSYLARLTCPSQNPHCLKYIWRLPTALLAQPTTPPAPLQLADGHWSPHVSTQHRSNRKGCLLLLGYVTSEMRITEDHLTQTSQFTEEEVKVQRGEVTIPRHHRQLNCRHRTEAKVSASPSGPLPTTPHYNFTALNHGSLRNISFNFLRPGAQPCWAVPLGQMEISTFLWHGGRIFCMRHQIGNL